MLNLSKVRTFIGSMAMALFFTSTMFSLTANSASIKNGIVCKKSGQKVTVGGKRYVCGKNPFLTPTKLTWMLKECPETYKLFVNSKDQYDIFKDILNSAGEEGKIESDKLLAGINSLENLMKNQVCKKGK
jgi:hypothetical protein